MRDREYTILSSVTTSNLETQVNHFIQGGWEVAGGLTLDNYNRVYQAMVKRGPPEEKEGEG